jgi:hypothetical protein
MKLWVFACQFLRNIQIGHDSGLWAVSALDRRTSNNRWSKAQKMFPFSRGVIYSSTDRTFTMPFVTQAFPEDKIVTDVWPEPWEFPFPIQPLGSPCKLLSLDAAKHSWPILQTRSNPTHCLNGMNGRTVFVPNEIDDADWQQILRNLGEIPDTFPQPEDPIERLLRDLL